MRRVVDRWGPWIAGAVLLAGIAAFAVTRYTGSATTATPPPHRKAALAPAELQVLQEFLDTAVARRDLGRAWTIVAPELKQGMSLTEWKTGVIPVVPYPVAKANVGVHTVDSFQDVALLKVTFLPKPGAAVASATFAAGLRNVDGHWLVSSWQPASTIGPGAGK